MDLYFKIKLWCEYILPLIILALIIATILVFIIVAIIIDKQYKRKITYLKSRGYQCHTVYVDAHNKCEDSWEKNDIKIIESDLIKINFKKLKQEY